jgi:hypothetical protein
MKRKGSFADPEPIFFSLHPDPPLIFFYPRQYLLYLKSFFLLKIQQQVLGLPIKICGSLKLFRQLVSDPSNTRKTRKKNQEWKVINTFFAFLHLGWRPLAQRGEPNSPVTFNKKKKNNGCF